MRTPSGRLVSVNVGESRTVEWRGRQVTTAIWKEPVPGRVEVRGVNLDGDDQADRRVHGGVDKAVYGYALEDYQWWERQVGDTLPLGAFGENLTIEGVDVNGARVGDRWEVGTAVLEVSQPRLPCYKLGIRMGDDGFPDRFTAAGRPGAYLRILEEGHVGAGDSVTVVPTEAVSISVAEIAAIASHQPERAAELVGVPGIPEGWIRWAERQLRRRA